MRNLTNCSAAASDTILRSQSAPACPAKNTRAGISRKQQFFHKGPGLQEIARFYDLKTRSILYRYGPGPRVHYHAGLMTDCAPASATASDLHERLVAAQERSLEYAARVWNAPLTLSGDVLDIGCGLGGGSIFWAQNFGARVMAVTCVPSHIDWVGRFAAQAGVESQVIPVLHDAAELPGENQFDAAVAVDSTGYLPRKRWFRRLASLLRPKGHVFIMDCFLGRPEYAEPYNRHWLTSIGTIDEYLEAARDASLSLRLCEDISPLTEYFWATTVALMRLETEGAPSQAVISRRQASIRMHELVHQGLSDGGYHYAIMAFSRTGVI